MSAPAPIGLLAELTHRCPLSCPYCSNPLDLAKAKDELPADVWARVFREAADLGALQLHLSGGEPLARRDLEAIVAAAREAELYVNLITSGVGLTPERLERLKAAGLDHVQLSVQDVDAANADRIAGYAGGFVRKEAAARAVVAAGLPLTVNAPIHRLNAGSVPALIELALAWDAGRIEIAHVQYYGWGLKNRAALLPTRAQVEATVPVVERERERLRGRLVVDFVLPDYFAERPKACMGGWGRDVIVVTPTGEAWPCHAAGTIPGLAFESVRDRPLGEIWREGAAFARFRGTDWMPDPCRTCVRAESDWGGCRCQALAIAGDAAATDPACALSPAHGRMQALAEAAGPAELVYRPNA